MPTHETSPLQRAGLGPEIQCLQLPAFEEANWESVLRAFAPAKSLPLRQAWQPTPSPNFASAVVSVGWRNESLLVFAELTDFDIYSLATGRNQRMWELGDTLEIFLRPEGQEAYVEFHVTPHNQRLQLRIPNTAALRHSQAVPSIAAFLVAGDVFHSATRVEPKQQRWWVFARIPAAAVGAQVGNLEGSRWHFSFSRYDATRGGGEPVISSTSPHTRPDFHSQAEWGVLHFTT